MTRFADDLFDDLMREHGQALAHASVPAARQRHLTARPVLMTAGAGGLAAVAAVGTLVATGGGSPAYAVTTHPNGTVTLAVYQSSGVAGVNSKLHELGDRLVVVPIQPGCPSISSLPAPAVPAKQISVEASASSDGSVTVDAQGVPVGDILVLGFSETSGRFTSSMQESMSQGKGQAHGQSQSHDKPIGQGHSDSAGRAQAPSGDGFGPVVGTAQPVGIVSRLTSGPAPSCVSIPAVPAPGRPGGTGVSASGSAAGKS